MALASRWWLVGLSESLPCPAAYGKLICLVECLELGLGTAQLWRLNAPLC
jgi:hypothetical protein